MRAGEERDHFGTKLLQELRKGQSILRSAANVSFSRLRLPLAPGARILDAGGPTTASRDAVPFPGSHLTFSANLDRTRLPHLVADLDGFWPLKEASFDAVMSFWVLEHLRRPHRFFEQSYRCLKPGGFLLLSTVLIHPKHASPHDYFRFTDDGLRSLARDAGFEDHRAVNLLPGPMQSLCAMASPWFLFPFVRYLASLTSRLADSALTRISPTLTQGWCMGYILMARKGPASRS